MCFKLGIRERESRRTLGLTNPRARSHRVNMAVTLSNLDVKI
jgi:hypothetical protein